MARALAGFEMMTAIHKHYSINEWQEFVAHQDESVLRHVMVSTGTSASDYEKVKPYSLLSRSCVSSASMWPMAMPNTSSIS